MSTYTTGEVAQMCEVTVRTVQYYDNEGLLHPSAVSEGGRRLYSDADVNKLKEITMMKSLGASLSVIKEVLESDKGYDVLKVFLEEQNRKVTQEIEEMEAKKKKITAVIQNIDIGNWASVKTEDEFEKMIAGRKMQTKTYALILSVGFVVDAFEVAGITTWILTGSPWLFIGVLIMSAIAVIPAVLFAYRRLAYLCPECHVKFTPRKAEWFFSKHTSKLRKLTCTCCGYKGYCIESYAEESAKN